MSLVIHFGRLKKSGQSMLEKNPRCAVKGLWMEFEKKQNIRKD